MMNSSPSSPNFSQDLLILREGIWAQAWFKLEYQTLLLQLKQEVESQIDQGDASEPSVKKFSLPVQYELVSSPMNDQTHVISLVDTRDTSGQAYCAFSTEEALNSFIEKISRSTAISTEPISIRKVEDTAEDSDTSISSATSASSVREKLRRASFTIPKMKDLLNSKGLNETPKSFKNESRSASLSLLSPPSITNIKRTTPITPPRTEPFEHTIKPFPQEKPILSSNEDTSEEEIKKAYVKRLDSQASVLAESSWITQWVEFDITTGRLKLFSEILSRKIIRDTIDLLTSHLELISFERCSELFTLKISSSLSTPSVPINQSINPASLPKVWILSFESLELLNKWISYVFDMHDCIEKRNKELKAKANAIPIKEQEDSSSTPDSVSKESTPLPDTSSSTSTPSVPALTPTPSRSVTPAPTPMSTPNSTPVSTPTIAPKKLKLNTNFLTNMLNTQMNVDAAPLPEEKPKETDKKEDNEEDNNPQAQLMKQLMKKTMKIGESETPSILPTITSSCPSQLSPIQESINENDKTPIDGPIPFAFMDEKLDDDSKKNSQENMNGNNDLTLHINYDKIKEASELISELTFSIEKVNFPLGDRLLRRLLLWYCSNGFSLSNGEDVDRFVEEIQADPQTDSVLKKFFSQKFDLFESWGSFLSILHQYEDNEAKKLARNPFQMQLNQLNDGESTEDLSLVISIKHPSKDNINFSLTVNQMLDVSTLIDIFSKNLNIDSETISQVAPQILYNSTQSFLTDTNKSKPTSDNPPPLAPLSLIQPEQTNDNPPPALEPNNKGIFSLILNRFSEDYVLLQDLLLYQEDIVKDWWTKVANNKQVMKQKDTVINDLYEQITTLKEKKQEEEGVGSNIKNFVNDIFSTKESENKSKYVEEDDDELTVASGVRKSSKSIINELKINKQNYILEKQKLIDEIMILKLSLNPNTTKFYQQLQQNEELRKNLEDKLVEAHIEIDKHKDFIFCLQSDIENKNIIINECESQISSLKYKNKEMQAEIEALKVKVSVAEMIAKSNSYVSKQVTSTPIPTPLSPGYSDNIDLLTLANLDSPVLKNHRQNEPNLGSDTDHPYLPKFEINEDINIHIPSKPQSQSNVNVRDENPKQNINQNPNILSLYSNENQDLSRDLFSPFERSEKVNVMPSIPSSGPAQRSTSSLRNYMASNPQTPLSKTSISQQGQESPYQIRSTKNTQQMYNEYRGLQNSSVASSPYNFSQSSKNSSYNQDPNTGYSHNYPQSNNYQPQTQAQGLNYMQTLYGQQQHHPLRNALREEMKNTSRGTPERKMILSRRGTSTPTTPEPNNMSNMSNPNTRFMSPTNSWNLKSNR